jgi:hypothetical protein
MNEIVKRDENNFFNNESLVNKLLFIVTIIIFVLIRYLSLKDIYVN